MAADVRALTALDGSGWQDLLASEPTRALAALRLAARHGVPRAQALLGQRLLSGIGTVADSGEAAHWFRVAADNDDADAMNMLGRCYQHGWGMAVDAQMAVYWYGLAAQRDLDWGMYNLANLMMIGAGTPADRAGALGLYQRAAAKGHAKSINIIGRFHEEGWEMPADEEQAFALYRQAADGGDFRACFNYARLLAERGAAEQACVVLRRIPSLSTPAFLHNVRGWLRAHALPALRALASEPAFAAGVSA
ncbi:sel1 repeat family protein [Duganella sp. FT80W]|uniref:Sel1 repeat family protein n=2 Tax=Duganella guangzhouensis TaxID=2666084 RepID=A0A6I2L0W3_9BURK|nr:tetratricopeptide repeat protein [Duganella guangzhouensis]MRW89919.1 sel1 repeat family protein [Duganella guangzhouensis]